MQRSAVSIAIEQALRAELALTDQPRVALEAIAEELFASLDHIAASGDQRGAQALQAAQREFEEVFARVWREYGGDGALPPPSVSGDSSSLYYRPRAN